MKFCSLLLLIFLLSLSKQALGQARDPIPDSLIVEPTKYVLTIGLLEGGSAIGGNIEWRLFEGVGAQVGTGIIGLSTGLNFHFNSDIKSSFFSIMYVHQGFGKLFLQSMFGPAYTHRWKNGLSGQIGVGFLSGYGAKWGRNFSDNVPPAVQPMVAFGYYF